MDDDFFSELGELPEFVLPSGPVHPDSVLGTRQSPVTFLFFQKSPEVDIQRTWPITSGARVTLTPSSLGGSDVMPEISIVIQRTRLYEFRSDLYAVLGDSCVRAESC